MANLYRPLQGPAPEAQMVDPTNFSLQLPNSQLQTVNPLDLTIRSGEGASVPQERYINPIEALKHAMPTSQSDSDTVNPYQRTSSQQIWIGGCGYRPRFVKRQLAFRPQGVHIQQTRIPLESQPLEPLFGLDDHLCPSSPGVQPESRPRGNLHLGQRVPMSEQDFIAMVSFLMLQTIDKMLTIMFRCEHTERDCRGFPPGTERALYGDDGRMATESCGCSAR